MQFCADAVFFCACLFFFCAKFNINKKLWKKRFPIWNILHNEICISNGNSFVNSMHIFVRTEQKTLTFVGRHNLFFFVCFFCSSSWAFQLIIATIISPDWASDIISIHDFILWQLCFSFSPLVHTETTISNPPPPSFTHSSEPFVETRDNLSLNIQFCVVLFRNAGNDFVQTFKSMGFFVWESFFFVNSIYCNIFLIYVRNKLKCPTSSEMLVFCLSMADKRQNAFCLTISTNYYSWHCVFVQLICYLMHGHNR